MKTQTRQSWNGKNAHLHMSMPFVAVIALAPAIGALYLSGVVLFVFYAISIYLLLFLYWRKLKSATVVAQTTTGLSEEPPLDEAETELLDVPLQPTPPREKNAPTVPVGNGEGEKGILLIVLPRKTRS